ncbi:hypothetical protein OUZ56_022911 [Daphnia magna]|uniref:Uncharacterized protein n=1 Tax=Daphnia magna TaxID=35525 RepID=A0ABR0AXV0_9CRUS|nr:hypothetical protein OUZ56_022911 [Daphnia magna]
MCLTTARNVLKLYFLPVLENTFSPNSEATLSFQTHFYLLTVKWEIYSLFALLTPRNLKKVYREHIQSELRSDSFGRWIQQLLTVKWEIYSSFH